MAHDLREGLVEAAVVGRVAELLDEREDVRRIPGAGAPDVYAGGQGHHASGLTHPIVAAHAEIDKFAGSCEWPDNRGVGLGALPLAITLVVAPAQLKIELGRGAGDGDGDRAGSVAPAAVVLDGRSCRACRRSTTGASASATRRRRRASRPTRWSPRGTKRAARRRPRPWRSRRVPRFPSRPRRARWSSPSCMAGARRRTRTRPATRGCRRGSGRAIATATVTATDAAGNATTNEVALELPPPDGVFVLAPAQVAAGQPVRVWAFATGGATPQLSRPAAASLSSRRARGPASRRRPCACAADVTLTATAGGDRAQQRIAVARTTPPPARSIALGAPPALPKWAHGARRRATSQPPAAHAASSPGASADAAELRRGAPSLSPWELGARARRALRGRLRRRWRHRRGASPARPRRLGADLDGGYARRRPRQRRRQRRRPRLCGS